MFRMGKLPLDDTDTSHTENSTGASIPFHHLYVVKLVLLH